MLRTVITLILVLSAGLFSSPGFSRAAGKTAKAKNQGKILVVYFSLQGNTRAVARAIQSITGGDLAEIVSEEDYNRPGVEDDAKRQIEEGYMPKIKKLSVNPDDYDTIFIGSPVWWFTLAPPVRRFLHDNDFKGKRVAPFCTCISAHGNIFDDFRKYSPGADMAEGLNTYDAELKDRAALDRRLRKWIDESTGKKQRD